MPGLGFAATRRAVGGVGWKGCRAVAGRVRKGMRSRAESDGRGRNETVEGKLKQANLRAESDAGGEGMEGGADGVAEVAGGGLVRVMEAGMLAAGIAILAAEVGI